MIAAHLSTATSVTLIVAGFFILLALIALARGIFSRNPPAARRFRVGVFVERDHELVDTTVEGRDRDERGRGASPRDAAGHDAAAGAGGADAGRADRAGRADHGG